MTNGNVAGLMGFENTGFTLIEEFERYESESEYESESFFEDRYVPQYVSNRNLPSTALEYFNDSGNSIYGKLKL